MLLIHQREWGREKTVCNELFSRSPKRETFFIRLVLSTLISRSLYFPFLCHPTTTTHLLSVHVRILRKRTNNKRATAYSERSRYSSLLRDNDLYLFTCEGRIKNASLFFVFSKSLRKSAVNYLGTCTASQIKRFKRRENDFFLSPKHKTCWRWKIDTKINEMLSHCTDCCLSFSGAHEVSSRLSLLTAIHQIHHKSLAPERLREWWSLHFDLTSASRRSTKWRVALWTMEPNTECQNDSSLRNFAVKWAQHV